MNSSSSWYGCAFALSFYGLVCLLGLSGSIPIAITWAYSAASLFAFLLYRHDKRAAQNRTQRLPENLLQIVSLLCGWPGALLAQRLLRHKNRKTAFQRVFWGAALMNIGLVTWLYTKNAPLWFR